MRAADVMSRPVVTVRADDSVEQATAVLTSHNITSAPVVDSAGDLVGMLSEGDLLRGRVTAEGAVPPVPVEPRPVTVADVMSTTVVVMSTDADLADVAEAMLYNDVRSVPVVEDDAQLAGIVSRRDILRAAVRTDDIIQMDVQHRLDDYAGERQWTVTVSGGVARVVGRYADSVDERIVAVLARTVPGVSEVELGTQP
jgi:CBS-domain-containing membrane protein